MVSDRRARALGSLHGLALGDALGSQFFVPDNRAALEGRRLPPSPWSWTDDAEMACSVFAVLVASHLGTAGLPAHWLSACEPLPPWAVTWCVA